MPSLRNVRLESADGSLDIPAQFDVLASWPDGSVKSALTQFVTDAGPRKSYRLAYGRTVARAAVASGVSVIHSDAGTAVDTGAIKYVVDPRGVISTLWRDANHDGAYDVSEQVLVHGTFYMVNAADDTQFTAAQGPLAEVVVEEQGPVRSVIRARGALADKKGAVLMKYLVRYYSYAGSDKLDIEFTVIDDRLEADVDKVSSKLALAVKSYGLRWDCITDSPLHYRFGLDDDARIAEGAVAGEHFLIQNGDFVFDNGEDRGTTFTYRGVARGARAPGWMALDAGTRHVALMVRDFWQQYPIELNVRDKTLTAALFSDREPVADTTLPTQSGTRYKRPNSFYFARPGGAKTHQLRLAFSDSPQDARVLAQLNAGFQRHRLELTAEPSWYADSGVFGDIDTSDPSTSKGYSAMLLQNIYVPSIERETSRVSLRDSVEVIAGDATMFGWRDYGDRLRAGWNSVVNGVRVPSFYNDTHIGANGFFHEFVRTGEQRWFALGEISTRHFADIDVAHGPRKGHWDSSYPGMGQQPPGEIHAISHTNEDHQVRNMHWGHAHVSGLSDLYLLTGDKRSLEVLSEIAAWWKFVTPYFFRLPFDKTKFREAERDFGWPLYVMNEYVRVTGDADYHKKVNGQLVNYLIQWWQTPIRHVGYDPVLGLLSNQPGLMNDASRGTGYWTMTLMDNSAGSKANGTNPWMAGPLLSSLIRFYEEDRLLTPVGRSAEIPYATLEDMMLQCMNYVVKYGYDPQKKWFVYSEAMRDSSGGHTLIDFPLAYLDRLYRRRVALGALPHPEWYDTRPMWAGIAQADYDELMAVNVGSSTQDYGFYGYEMVFPVDFFRIMRAH